MYYINIICFILALIVIVASRELRFRQLEEKIESLTKEFDNLKDKLK